MTHADLVTVAVRWLRNQVRCGVVLQEPPPVWAAESPDAIGWRGYQSFMVECKRTRSDFRADQRKYGRVRGPRLAWCCYYLTPAGLLKPEEVPEAWGLLEVHGRGVRLVRDVPAEVRERDERDVYQLQKELYLLYAELRRYHAQGLTYQTMTGRTAQAHLLDLAWPDGEIREARRLMGLEPRP